MANSITFDEIKQLYPNEWVLLGDPEMNGSIILNGVVVFHASTKQGLLEGRHLLQPFQHSTWTFTGEIQRGTRQWVGIFRQMPRILIFRQMQKRFYSKRQKVLLRRK